MFSDCKLLKKLYFYDNIINEENINNTKDVAIGEI